VSDIGGGGLSVQVFVEYMQILNLVDGVDLQPDNTDQHIWHLSSHGTYSSKSTYDAFFTGSWWRVWKT
jgi:hypothetical protein